MALVDLGLRGANEAGPRAGWVAAVQAAASATTAAQAQAAAAATMATKAVVTVAVGLRAAALREVQDQAGKLYSPRLHSTGSRWLAQCRARSGHCRLTRTLLSQTRPRAAC